MNDPGKQTKSSKEKLDELLRDYLVSNPIVKSADGVSEVEVRFGTGKRKPISKIQFNQVVQQLQQCGFESDNIQGVQMLRVIPETRDKVSGIYKTASIRAEITGTDMIQEYCKTNSIEKLTNMKAFAYNKLKFTQKNNPKRPGDRVVGGGGYENYNQVDFDDFEFRVSYKMEKDFSVTTPFVWQMVKDDVWMNTKKLFRSMNRVQFRHPDFPILADISIVKSSMKRKEDREKMIQHITIQQAEVFSRPETYEIELEIDNSRVGNGTAFDTAAKVGAALRAVIRIVMNGLQNTRFPIGKSEQEKVLLSYMRLIHGEEYRFPDNRNFHGLVSRDFIGPSSVTLQFENIVPLEKSAHGIPNIRSEYCVTDKADGERRLLYVSSVNGHVYLIDSNMNVTFTGTVSQNRLMWDSLLDGEHIKYDRDQKWVNRYAAFDIYYLGDRNQTRKASRPKKTSTPTGIRTDGGDSVAENGSVEGLKNDIGVVVEGGDAYVRNSSVREYPFMLEDEFGEVSETGENGAVRSGVKDVRNPDRVSRLNLLQKFVEEIQIVSVLSDSHTGKGNGEHNVETGFTIHCKTFYASLGDGNRGSRFEDLRENIFDQCAKVWSQIQDGTYLYQTDGLIFTPRHLPVGCNRVSDTCPNQRMTWAWSLKWKPPEFNTLDLLVSYKRNEKGREEIHYLLEDRILGEDGAATSVAAIGEVQEESDILETRIETMGVGGVGGSGLGGVGVGAGVVDSQQSIKQYRTLLLRCGSKGYGYMNPADDLLQEKYPPKIVSDETGMNGYGNKKDYNPVPFVGLDPYDPTAGYANMFLYNTGSDLVMRTEEGELFEENTIVEFSYDLKRPAGFRWIPLRVRHDKTAELRSGGRNYGNDWSVCVANWKTIHHPITASMITSGREIPSLENRTIGGEEGETVYYSRDVGQNRSQSVTRSLRDFHNLYVKRKLIVGAAHLMNAKGRGIDSGMEGVKLLDLSVGKGGDLNKFIAAGVSFVYGVDISEDNIRNPLDGVCARYLDAHRQSGSIFRGIFQVADSSRNIRKGEAFKTEKDKAVVRAIFGEGGKNADLLGKAPLAKRVFGWGENGFEVLSCQFSLHFMCENAMKFHGFMRNLAECTKVGGVFICTTFDGLELFKKLRGKMEGDTWTVFNEGGRVGGGGGERMFQLTKRYSESDFPEDEMGLGYGVDVFQESINKTFREYLVHPEFLRKVMFDYGFSLLRREEAQSIGFSSGSGLFSDLFGRLKEEAGDSGVGRFGKGGGDSGYGNAVHMSVEEKAISFLNRYYIFRKRHAVVPEEVLKQRRHNLRADSVWNLGVSSSSGLDKNIAHTEMRVEDNSVLVLSDSRDDYSGMDVDLENKKKGVLVSSEEVKKKEMDMEEKKPSVLKFKKILNKKVVLGDYSPVIMEKAVEKVAEEKASDVVEKVSDKVAEKVSDAAVVVKRFQPLKKAAPATKVRTTLKKKA
jgi:hypothetical protein